MERWSIRLQPYDFRIIHKAGKDNPADYMSRHPMCDQGINDDRSQKVSEEYINFVISNAVPKAMTLEQIEEATASDVILQKIFKCIKSNNWKEAQESKDLRQFYNIRDELCSSVDAKILLRGTRIVIPQSPQTEVIRLSHEGHQGITKTKKLLRQKVWFPCIDQAAEDAVNKCLSCQIPAFDRVFSKFGTPVTVKSDNGSPFNSEQFKKFAQYSGFKHRRITPCWPRANGEAERFMRTLKKSLQIAHVEKKNWKQEMYTFLRAYRSTPHTTTNKAPAEILLRYPFRGRIPGITKSVPDHPDEALRTRDTIAKQKMKEYRDSRRHFKRN